MYIAIAGSFEGLNQKSLTKIVGISPATMNRIVNQKQTCSEKTAYNIVKAVHENADIKYYFVKKEGIKKNGR